MICKEDLVSWFKDLESYKRIDIMCTLLNMCLPFELRFLGTCLEELGRRDSQELRGIELRVNNPQELAADIASCQSGEPTDRKIRRKMALYLALIRACSRSCVNELFKTLDCWGEKDFLKFNDAELLQELLLVYTMASNHPVFSFEQKMKCGEIFMKIKESKYMNCGGNNQQSSPQQEQSMHMHNQHQQIQNQIVIPPGNIPLGFHQAHLAQMIPTDGTNMPHPITVDGMQQMIPSNMAIPAEFAVGHPNALTWTVRPYPPPSLEHPPQSTSPMLSQQSSPSHSRPTSPNRSTNTNNMMQQQQQQQQQPTPQQQIRNNQQRGVTLRNSRRPSAETTPPPVQQQSQQNPILGLIGSDISLKSYDEVVVNIENQLSTMRNGYTRPGHHTIPRPSKSSHMHHHNQQQQQQQHHGQTHLQNMVGGPMQQPPHQTQNFTVNASLAYTLQNMSLMDGHNSLENNIISSRHKSGSAGMSGGGGGGNSDSSSSIGSAGEISPPDTPSLIASTSGSGRLKEQSNFKQQINMTRMNGRAEKLLSGIGSGTTVIYAHSANSPQQQQFVGNEIIVMPSLTNNNNSLSSSGSGSSSNNNIVTSTVLITSPSTVGGGGVSNVITTNPVVLQQQQFSATYPYPAQHLATTRPPILSHNPTIAPPPGAYRHPGFGLQPNGELVYPYPPQVAGGPAAGITFLAPSGAPPPPVVRSSPSSVQSGGPPPPQQQQQPVQPVPQPATSLLGGAASFTALTVGNKNTSCFNCGSQTHVGRDCQEASMEDVTRGSIYKLDYSTTISPSTPSGHGGNMSGNNSSSNSGLGSGGGNITTAEIATETSSPTLSSSSSTSNPK